MPPSEVTPTTQTPDKFDFMLKNQPKPKMNLRQLLPSASKPVKIILAGIFGVFLLIILSVLIFGGNSGKNDKIISVMAQAQEISRVCVLAEQSTQKPSVTTENLAFTVSAIMISQKAQLTSYLKSNHTKVSVGTLNGKLNKSTDSLIQSAAQTNNLDSVFTAYIKTQLSSYQTALQAAYKGAGKQAQSILSQDFDSIQTLQKAPQLSTN